MLLDCKKGRYIVDTNFRDAFRLDVFEEKYIEECFDKYIYIVGDISAGILRLKGFDTNPKSKNYFGLINDYLETACAIGCPYYILKRIQSDNEYQKELAKPTQPKTEGFLINTLVKESFDKESITLDSTARTNPNIVIDANKMNSIPKGELSKELRDIINSETVTTQVKETKVEEVTESYVSSSPDFVPSQQNHNHRNNRRNNKNKKK
jgi:uncharacterized protein YutD